MAIYGDLFVSPSVGMYVGTYPQTSWQPVEELNLHLVIYISSHLLVGRDVSNKPRTLLPVKDPGPYFNCLNY